MPLTIIAGEVTVWVDNATLRGPTSFRLKQPRQEDMLELLRRHGGVAGETTAALDLRPG